LERQSRAHANILAFKELHAAAREIVAHGWRADGVRSTSVKSAMEDALPVWFLPLFPLFFAGLLCLVSLILATVGGWRRLAESYPDDISVEGVTFRWQSAQFGSANYGRCVNVTVDHARLRLSIALLFRVAHPPISIPWSDIRVELDRSWLREIGTFTFAKEPHVAVRFKRRLVDRIAEASRGQLRIERVA
jgi:hypothetical protein